MNQLPALIPLFCLIAFALLTVGPLSAQGADRPASPEPHRHPTPDDPLLAQAVAMIDDGDAGGLRALLTDHPELVRQRLAGGHDAYAKGYFKDATLLHFVAANPRFEGERLPTNLAEIAEVILNAGAAVDAGCGEDGQGTTLGLVASGMLARTNGLQAPLIRLLVERGADPDRAMSAALAEGEIDAARLLVELGAAKTLSVYAAFDEPQEVKRIVTHENPSEHDRRLALAIAARYGHRGPIFYLCSADYGDTPNAYNPRGAHAHATPLHLAAYHGHLEAARELIKWGARLDTKDKVWEGTPRGWAEHGGHPEVVELIDEAAEVVPVMHTALAGDLDTLGLILDEQPEWLNAELPIFGSTLIGNLCYLNNRRTTPGQTIRFLIERGARIEKDGPGESYLHAAASDGNAELGIACIDALLDGGADINALGGVLTGGTPLHNATIFQLREIGAHLIARGAAVDLFLAAGNGRFDLVEAMFDEQGNRREDAPRVPSYQEDQTAQHDINWAFWVAGKAGDVQTLAFLYPKIDELVTIPDGSTVVDQAVQYERAEAEAWLRAQGLKTKAEYDEMRPRLEAVYEVIQRGDVEALRAWLDANPGLVNAWLPDNRRTLLHVVVDWPCQLPNAVAMVELLIEAGADPNARMQAQRWKETPLHWAASGDAVALIDALIDGGGDIDALGGVETGGTPLHDAVIFQQRKATARLLERGAAYDLFLAAGSGRFDLVHAMFDEQGNLREDAPRVPGWGEHETPEHRINWAFYVAAQAGDVETLEFLYPKVTELVSLPDGRTVVDRAIQHERTEAEAWLRAQGLKTKAERDTEGGRS